MKVNIHRADARGNVLTTLTGTRIVFRGKQLRVPAGFESDGASVPRLFWRLVCPPLDPRAVRAAVIHDYIYRQQPEGWDRRMADDLFFRLLVEDGVPAWRAWLAWFGVRIGGAWAWEKGKFDKAISGMWR